MDNRPEAIAQRKLQEMADNSPQAQEAAYFQNMADNSQRSQNPFQFESTISPTAQVTDQTMNQEEEEQRRKGPSEPFQFSKYAAAARSEKSKENSSTDPPLEQVKPFDTSQLKTYVDPRQNIPPFQFKDYEKKLNARATPNQTGLPDKLKAGVETFLAFLWTM